MKFTNNRISWFVLIVSLLINFTAAIYVKTKIDKKDETEFRYESNFFADKIESRVHALAQLLRSGAALFTASDSVTREEWKIFFEQHNMEAKLPGMLGISFVLKIPKDKLTEHIQKIRNEGFPEYVVWPENEREIYTSILFLEHLWGSYPRAFGYDMMSEPVRKKAMERACDKNKATLSDKVILVQEDGTDVQAGNLLYVPVYQKGAAINTVEQRRAALKGWVCSHFLMSDLMTGILPGWELQSKLHIYDGLICSSESLLFESHNSEKQKTANKNRFTLDIPIDLYGHQWTLVFTKIKENVFFDYGEVWGTFVGGFIISVLLFLFIRSLINTQYNAQKIAEKLTVELKESKNRFRITMETSPVAMVLSKMNNREILFANETFGKLFKILTSETIGQKLPDFYSNKKDRISLLKAVKTEGRVDNYELLLKKSDGKLFWCSMSLKLINLDDEEVLITAFHDITKRKNAEEEIMKHREHLEEMVAERTHELTISEQKLQQSVKDISDYKLALDKSSSVTISDSEGKIMHVNDNFCKTSKFSRDEVIGKTHKVIDGGCYSQDFFIELWSTVSKGKVWRGEIKNKTKDGSCYWVDATIIPFLDKNGKPYQYVSVRFDITNLKLIEADLLKAKQAADSANRAKSEFLANMSHEIRTPMNTVIGFSELLSKSVQNKKQRSQVESIRRSGKNLLLIINDILDLSKIEAGKIDIIPVPVNLCELLREIENMFAEKVKEKGIILSFEYEKVCTKTLLLDVVRFRQILFNLIGNAVKFTEKGYVSLSIEHGQNSEKEERVDLTILLKDTGIGIPAEQQEHIFEPFNQPPGQNHVKYGGTGLGLTITKKLIKNMGGAISFKSEVGKGSTFKIDLPNIPVSNSKIAVKPKTFDNSTVIFKPATIVVADDNEGNRKLIVDLLENSPLKIMQATNGKEAVEMAKKYSPDVILMDLRMPVMDGYEATKILKNEKLTKSIPIVGITATINSSKERDNLNKVFDECLQKPLDIAQLFDKLKKYLKYELVEPDSRPDNYCTENRNYKLPEELIQKIPAFIETLELEFMPEYKKVIKNQVINEIEKFGLNLLDISEKLNCQILIDYSNEIKAYAESFDFEKLMHTLKKFPELVDWLKAETN